MKGEVHIATALRLLLIQTIGGPLPATLGVARMDDPTSISQRPVGTSQADAVLVISSILAGVLLAASAAIVT